MEKMVNELPGKQVGFIVFFQMKIFETKGIYSEVFWYILVRVM